MDTLRASFLCAAVALAPALAGCGGDGDDLTAPHDYNDPATCNPLGTVNCLMPWPSAVYLAEDSTTETGYRIDIPAGAMPQNVDGFALDPAPFARYDGFGPTGVIIAGFPTGVSTQGLPGPDDIEASLGGDSPIILLDMDSGERVPFFAETDMNTDEPEEQSLLIRPMVRMTGGHRIAVGIRNTVKAADGSDLPVPPGFAALLAGTKYHHPLFSELAPRYDQIFPALEGEGVARDELVLAWDFVVASDDFLTRDMLHVRDAASTAIGEAGANLTFAMEDVPTSSEYVSALYSGTHTSPSFLTNGEADSSRFQRGSDGLPEQNGDFDAPFALIVPRCLATAELPRPVLIFGHGLFGTGQSYLDDDLLQSVAEDNCAIIAAGDFIGLTERQVTLAAQAANDTNHVWEMTEKLAQSVIDFIALENLVRGPLAADERLQRDGEPMIDPEKVYYYGASLGGIMGNVFMAYDPVVPRGVLGVPGGAWSLLLERSFAWTPLRVAMRGAYEDQYVYQTLVALFGLAFEPIDPITTSARVIHDPLPGTPAKQILIYETLGDSLVSNYSTEFVARTLDVPVVGPTVRTPWNMAVSTDVLDNGFAIYDEMRTPIPPPGNVSPDDDNGTHAHVHRRAAVLRQVGTFLLDGTLQDECKASDGTPVPCDCTTGACDYEPPP